MNTMKRVLILCTGNSARSQMAEGFLRHEGGAGYEVHSAGTVPGHVRPEAIEVMREAGIDISGQWSKSLDEYLGQKFDWVITVCDKASEQCPVFPGAERIAWSFEDPAAVEGDTEKRLEAFRRIRDEILGRLRLFLLANTER
jgi:arsenate reductase (thioredoxin)